MIINKQTNLKYVSNSFGNVVGISVNNGDDQSFVPLDPANTDYQQFKQEINTDEAQLQDVDGNVMSADAAKAFVAGLP